MTNSKTTIYYFCDVTLACDPGKNTVPVMYTKKYIDLKTCFGTFRAQNIRFFKILVPTPHNQVKGDRELRIKIPRPYINLHKK